MFVAAFYNKCSEKDTNDVCATGAKWSPSAGRPDATTTVSSVSSAKRQILRIAVRMWDGRRPGKKHCASEKWP